MLRSPRELEQLVDEGVIRALGVSNHSAKQLDAVLRFARIILLRLLLLLLLRLLLLLLLPLLLLLVLLLVLLLIIVIMIMIIMIILMILTMMIMMMIMIIADSNNKLLLRRIISRVRPVVNQVKYDVFRPGYQHTKQDIHVYIYIYIYKCMCMYIHICVYVYIYIYIYIYLSLSLSLYIYIYIYIYIGPRRPRAGLPQPQRPGGRLLDALRLAPGPPSSRGPARPGHGRALRPLGGSAPAEALGTEGPRGDPRLHQRGAPGGEPAGARFRDRGFRHGAPGRPRPPRLAPPGGTSLARQSV